MMDKCCLCGNEKEDGHRNNAEPLVKDGRCCDSCNQAKVLPARLKVIGNSDMAKYVKQEMGKFETDPNHREEMFEWVEGFKKRLLIVEHLAKYEKDELDKAFYLKYLEFHTSMLGKISSAKSKGEESYHMVDKWEQYMVELRDEFFGLMGSNEKVDNLLDKIKRIANLTVDNSRGSGKVVMKNGN